MTHVFVVMLENHSFDNMLAMSKIPGITAATTADFNSHGGQTYFVQPCAPVSMPTDPGHEFLDVVEQLAGPNATYPRGGPYPPIDNCGFAANYATSRSEKTGLPCPDQVVDVMACFDTQKQLPVLYQLATEFAVCDQWYSSIPGPTWPNRFFVHGASSAGLDHSPFLTSILEWESIDGFRYPNGSIYDALKKAGVPYRFYHDSDFLHRSLYSDNPDHVLAATGSVPQVSSLHGVTLKEVQSLQRFASDLQGDYPWRYTFIEPHYGDLLLGTYRGGSSQHPMDDVYGGDNLLAHVYAAIRNSPYWENSLLIITYDEHGGLYDSVAPGRAKAPGDNPPRHNSKYHFNFELYGVRVPAVVVSPRIPAGTVSHTVYDHASVLKTVEELFDLDPLTRRDAAAQGVLPLLTLAEPRTDCPTKVGPPAPPCRTEEAPMTAQELASIDLLPLPLSGNLVGVLQNLRKAEIDLSTRRVEEIAAIHARFQRIQTRGQARAYAQWVMDRVVAAREQDRLTSPGTP